MNKFSPHEVLRIAVAVENSGRIFYEYLENNAKDEKVKEVFRVLKEEETLHGKLFQQMLENRHDYMIYEFSVYEYEDYVKAIASMYVSTQELIENKINDPFNSEIEAIDFAIEMEKDSILTYFSLIDYLLPVKQPVLYKVIDEEKKHLVKLSWLKNYLIKGE